MRGRGRFRFPLEGVLKVRTLREDLARMALARAQLQLIRSREGLAATQSLMAESLNRLKMPEPWPPADYQRMTAYLEHLKRAREGWLARIARDETEVAEKRRHLEKLHQERRLLEGLRERRFRQFMRDLQNYLENQIEEVIISRRTSSLRRGSSGEGLEGGA